MAAKCPRCGGDVAARDDRCPCCGTAGPLERPAWVSPLPGRGLISALSRLALAFGKVLCLLTGAAAAGGVVLSLVLGRPILLLAAASSGLYAWAVFTVFSKVREP